MRENMFYRHKIGSLWSVGEVTFGCYLVSGAEHALESRQKWAVDSRIPHGGSREQFVPQPLDFGSVNHYVRELCT